MTEFVFCTLVIGFVECLVFGTYIQVRTFIENIVDSIEEKKFNKEWYLDHVELQETNTEFPILMGVYKKRV